MPLGPTRLRPKKIEREVLIDADIDAALRELFDDAIAIATRAKRAFDRKPLVKSRGVHELEPSPWFRLWDTALQGAVRLAMN